MSRHCQSSLFVQFYPIPLLFKLDFFNHYNYWIWEAMGAVSNVVTGQRSVVIILLLENSHIFDI